MVALCTVMVGFAPFGELPAAQLGLYVGGQYGDSSKDVGTAPFDDLAVSFVDEAFIRNQITTSLETDDSGFGFLVGYRLTPHLAVEGGYMDLGKVRYRNRSIGTFQDQPVSLDTNLTADTSGIGISVLGILPLSYRWEVYGRGGVLIATSDMSAYLNDGAAVFVDQFSESSTDLFGGVGVSFSFAEIYQARLEVQRVFDAGDEVTGEGDVDLVTFGITVTF